MPHAGCPSNLLYGSSVVFGFWCLHGIFIILDNLRCQFGPLGQGWFPSIWPQAHIYGLSGKKVPILAAL